MNAADTVNASEQTPAVVADFLEVGRKRPAGRDIVMGTQKLLGVSHQLLFATDLTFSSHGRDGNGKKKKNQEARDNIQKLVLVSCFLEFPVYSGKLAL